MFRLKTHSQVIRLLKLVGNSSYQPLSSTPVSLAERRRRAGCPICLVDLPSPQRRHVTSLRTLKKPCREERGLRSHQIEVWALAQRRAFESATRFDALAPSPRR